MNLPGGDVIVVAADNQSIITELKPEFGNVDARIPTIKGLSSQVYQQGWARRPRHYWCRYRDHVDCCLSICGTDRLLLYLAGDVIPDQKLAYPWISVVSMRNRSLGSN